MLVAKISPEATFNIKENPFGPATLVSIPFMTVEARNYVAGAALTEFSVAFVFGLANEQDKTIKGVTPKQGARVGLTAEELSTWGTDDSVLLNLVAAKLGTSVVEIYTAVKPTGPVGPNNPNA